MIKLDKKTVFLIALIVAAAGGALIVRGCRHASHTKEGEKAAISHYTCPMHPHIHEDKPGECPICHMKLVPVYQEGAAPEDAAGGGPSVSISPERQQLIGVRTTAVIRTPQVKELRAPGRVAFDPELAAAEREFVEIAKNVPELKNAAASKLKRLGLADDEIKALEKSGKVKSDLYLPEAGGSVWVYATLYGGDIDLVEPGMEAAIGVSGDDTAVYSGKVRGIDRVLDPMTRSARARIEVPGAGGKLRPESFVDVAFQIPLGEVMTLPKTAVIETGTRKVAFVVHEGRHFSAREIKTGAELAEDVVVLEGLEEGEMVAATAAFMIDAESQLKAAVSGMGGHSH